MNKTLDAKFLIAYPNVENRKRIQSLIDRELCEIFIIDDYTIFRSLLLQLEKSILVLDFNTLKISDNINDLLTELLEACGSRLLKILTIDSPSEIISHKKILNYKSDFIRNDQNIIDIVNGLGVWGPRNYIRLGNKSSRIALFRMKNDNNWRTGVIHDISASGMSCSFDKYSDININAISSDIEVCIKDQIFHLTGNFLLRRTFKATNTFVLVFSRKKSIENVQNLNSIIYRLTMDSILEKIKNLSDSVHSISF